MALMHALYEGSGGDEQRFIGVADITQKVEAAPDSLRAAIQYLEGEGLLTAMKAWGGDPLRVQIRHAGVVEVEQGLTRPDAPTEHLAPLNSIVIYGDVRNSQIGAGSTVNQHASFDASQLSEVRAWLQRYRSALSELDDDLRPLAEKQLDQAEIEIETESPRRTIVHGLLGSLREFANAALTAAGTSAGTLALSGVIQNWPL